jgi:carboxysome shell carbonic anhydrase
MYAKRRQIRSTCWAGVSPNSGYRATVAAPTYAEAAGTHPLTRQEENIALARYEESVKGAFDGIEGLLREVAAMQHEADFERRAQALCKEALGYELPAEVLARAWVDPLDMRALYAWCVFETYREWVERYYLQPAGFGADVREFATFLESCGYHYLDFTPCSDGRLAHAVRYVLRLPEAMVRRRAHAGGMFEVEDSLEKWIEVEHGRYRQGEPNAPEAGTRYLKVVMYHYSSSDPHRQGCAAHGSDQLRAAEAGLTRLVEFKTAIETSFCCGAAVDLLLIGIDTDTDAVRIHVPDGKGEMTVARYVDAHTLYEETRARAVEGARQGILAKLKQACTDQELAEPASGMLRLMARLIENNFSQIDYVRRYHGGAYPDVGHEERFIGTGAGFDELQLRNLTYFAYLKTVEEGVGDLDVGIKIFKGLNVARGLPVPVVVRFDYAGGVPGARDRAVERCLRVGNALQFRYAGLVAEGKLHVLMVVRNSQREGGVEVVGSTVLSGSAEVH